MILKSLSLTANVRIFFGNDKDIYVDLYHVVSRSKCKISKASCRNVINTSTFIFRFICCIFADKKK